MSKDSSSSKVTRKGKVAPATNVATYDESVFNRVVGVCGSIFIGAVLFFGGQFIGAIVFFGILAAVGLTGDEATSTYSDNTILQLALLCVVGLITIYGMYRYLKWRRVKATDFLLVSRRPTLQQLFGIVPVYFIYFVCLIVATIIVGLFTGIDVNQSQELGIEDPKSSLDMIILFTMLVVVTPIYEEILFRGFLYNHLRKFSSIIVACIVTSVLFGIAHLEYENLNWIAAVDTFIFSLFLIYVSQKHQSLYSAILLHAAKNSIAFYVLFVR